MLPSREQGFTLVEVLVALVVTSLLLGIVMNAVLQSKKRASFAEDKKAALLLAGNLIAERTIAPFDTADASGEMEGLRWRVSEKTLAADPRRLVTLAEINVAVTDERGTVLAALQTRKLKSLAQQP